jgi:hypothetical protein
VEKEKLEIGMKTTKKGRNGQEMERTTIHYESRYGCPLVGA